MTRLVTATGDRSSDGNGTMRPMPFLMDSQWTRSAAGIVVGLLLISGGLRAGQGLGIPSELRPVIEFVVAAACVLVPGPVLTPPGVAPRLDAGPAGR